MYQALYRKWRPKTFDDVVGQSHITETLKRQVSTDRLSHAYLFIGTRGTGKTTCAKILAKAVNCESPVNGNPCNVCPSCRGIEDGSVMDVVEMDAASNNGVDNVRQLRDEAIFSPAGVKKRVYIVDEVHMLSASAFNALLKILEEPPEHLMFILATTELNKVPATILSRCQRHSFKRLDAASIVHRLQYVAEQEQLALTQSAAELIAGLSDGGMRDALSMLDQCAGRETIDTDTVYSAMGLAGNREIARLLEQLAAHDTAAALGQFSALWQAGKDPSTLLGELSDLMRDILMTTVAPKGGKALLSGGYDEALLASFRGRFTADALVSAIDTVQTALGEMRGGQAKTVCELCLITLSEPQLGDTLPALRARVAALEQQLAGSALPSPAPASPPVPAIPQEDPPPFDLPEPIAAPAPKPEPQPEPIAAPAPEPQPAGGGDGLWQQLCGRMKQLFPVGISAILCDCSQVHGYLEGDTLTLEVEPGFASNMVSRPDVASRLAAAAGELTGYPVQVRMEKPGSRPADSADKAEKLDALKKFDIVTFK